jgi:hypothetical protein
MIGTGQLKVPIILPIILPVITLIFPVEDGIQFLGSKPAIHFAVAPCLHLFGRKWAGERRWKVKRVVSPPTTNYNQKTIVLHLANNLANPPHAFPHEFCPMGILAAEAISLAGLAAEVMHVFQKLAYLGTDFD